MSVIVVMSVFEEELMLPGALASLDHAGADRVVVFDGAWELFARGVSTDRTVEIAQAWGAEVREPVHESWPSQQDKRTAMFRDCGATADDHVFVMDADERAHGRFGTLPPGAACVLIADAGENDLPGIRGEWPYGGDYSRTPKPEVRLFRWSPMLNCLWPGGYHNEQGRIIAYRNSEGDSALPVLEGISLTHHAAERSPERIARKIAYYTTEHPLRKARQDQWFGGG